MKLPFSIAVVCCLIVVTSVNGQENQSPVGDRLLPTGRSITPAGQLTTFPGRPVDLVEHNGTLFVKDHRRLRALDGVSLETISTASIEGGASLYGIACGDDGRVYVSNAKNHIRIYEFKDRKLANIGSIALAMDSFPCGICLSEDQNEIYICLSKKNKLAIVDLATKEVTSEIAVGVAPFDCHVLGEHILVSNIGGRLPTDPDQTAPSAGTETVVDKRGIASTGSVSIISRMEHVAMGSIRSGLHPTVIEGFGNRALVCNTNEDSVSLLELDSQTSKVIDVKPNPELPFGSMPSCTLVVQDKFLLVALAGNNAIAVFESKDQKKFELLGHIPTAWYPASLASNGTDLYVGSVKGIGSRADRRPLEKGRNSHDHEGAVQKIKISDFQDANMLRRWSSQVHSNSKIPQIIRNRLLEQPLADVAAKPIPDKLGQPSQFKHVIYVIKENRTFDQLFGDYKEARSEPKLCLFPREKTPNHHALADRFGILDNYYCNGVLSADGHSWATEGNVTPYLERAFGGFSRSYTFGDDPITYSSSGFIWDHVLAAGLSFRNYGEMDYAKIPNGMKYQEVYKKFVAGEHIQFEQTIGIERLKRYSCRDYPGWNMDIPDVLRVDRFLSEFRQFEKENSLPNFCIVYLPEDHLGAAGITSDAHMADNDLALGKLVAAVSKSKFWKDTVIFVNEDDPQNGFDHIDGHRSICLVISPYSKQGVNHNFYNQTSVLRTILHIFGLPPMNQQDGASPLMRNCFNEVADMTPYSAITPATKLNESTGKQSSWSPSEQKWRDILATVPIERTGMKTERDEDNLNRFIWHEAKGWETPYPIDFAGAHGKGLHELGLSFESKPNED